MKLKLFHALLLTVMSSGAVVSQNQYNLPAEISQGNILHCFDWKMSDVQKELPAIAEAGFNAIQISPVQRNISSGAIWYDVYRPFDFKFIDSNGLGKVSDLKTLCSEAEKYGIKIIVDVVFNHVDGGNYHDPWWNSNGRVRSGNSFINYGNRYSITHDKLGDYCEVNSEDADVTARAKAYIEELKSYGVKGIRFDAAKHVALPSEGTPFWKEVTSVPGIFYYGEILGNPGGSNANVLMKEYTDYMAVTDEAYSSSARNSMGVPSSTGNWTSKGIDASRLVYWGESHDTYSNTPEYGGVTNNMAQNVIDRAYAILASRSAGVGLYFSRPTTQNTGSIKVGNKGTTHFTSKEVAEVNKFKNAMVGKEDAYGHNGSAGAVVRKGGGAVIVSKAAYASVEVPNTNGLCPAGKYYDRVSGNEFTVTSTTIKGKTGGTGIAVIYGDFIPGDDFDYDTGEGSGGGSPDKIYVYCTNPMGWSDVYVYMYSSGGAAMTNGGWPGVKMTRRGDLWEYEVPENLWYNTRVMFNDGKNGGQYPGHVDSNSEDGYLLNGKTMISDGTGNSNWKEFDNSNVGITDAEAESEYTEIRWFTLQGVPVARPDRGGIYIKVQGRKSTKILVN